MIRMLTPIVREIMRGRANAQPSRDPILDPHAGVVHGDGLPPARLLRNTTIIVKNGPRTQPFVDPPRQAQAGKPRARRRRTRRRTFSPPLRGLFGPRSLR